MRGWTGEGGRDPDIRVVESFVDPKNITTAFGVYH
jgi:hypothetical protein